MHQYNLEDESGFFVHHNSGNWRVAVHNYEENINGKAAFHLWGCHHSSEEAFVILQGEGFLVIASDRDGEHFQVYPLKFMRLFVVGCAEYHALLLRKGASVLIIENKDMTNSESVVIKPGVIAEVFKECKI